MTLKDVGAYGWGSLHADVVASQTGIELNELTAKNIRYVIGGGNNFKQITRFFESAQVKIIHWIGSDVMKAVNGECEVYRNAIHWADGFNLLPELEKVGIHAKMVTWKPRNTPIGPLPLGDRVCVYMPPTRHDFFRYDLMKEVEKEYGRPFIWLDAKEQDQNSVDIPALIRQSRVLIRAPIHDGLSHTVMEFLVAGRTVLNTQPLPYCIPIKPTVRDILSKINTKPTPEAPYFWLDFIDKHHVKYALEEICKQQEVLIR